MTLNPHIFLSMGEKLWRYCKHQYRICFGCHFTYCLQLFPEIRHNCKSGKILMVLYSHEWFLLSYICIYLLAGILLLHALYLYIVKQFMFNFKFVFTSLSSAFDHWLPVTKFDTLTCWGWWCCTLCVMRVTATMMCLDLLRLLSKEEFQVNIELYV